MSEIKVGGGGGGGGEFIPHTLHTYAPFWERGTEYFYPLPYPRVSMGV